MAAKKPAGGGPGPYLPWYVDDVLASPRVTLMSLEEEGAYRRLLDVQWQQGSIPHEISHLARLCKGVSVQKMRKIWASVGPCFDVFPGEPGRQNPKLRALRAERLRYVESQARKGAAGAARTWGRGQEREISAGSGDGRGHSPAIAGPMAERWPSSPSPPLPPTPPPTDNSATANGGDEDPSPGSFPEDVSPRAREAAPAQGPSGLSAPWWRAEIKALLAAYVEEESLAEPAALALLTRSERATSVAELEALHDEIDRLAAAPQPPAEAHEEAVAP